ncbi:hypothetical protein D9M72_200080 [compost metagenome]
MQTKSPFITHRDGPIDINFTQLQGTIQASQVQLEAAFGAPQKPEHADNVTTTWAILFTEQQVIATIYDWHKRNTNPAEVITWNIGGKFPNGRQAVEMVHAGFRAANGLNAAPARSAA